jgi:hypothetical protein
VDNLYSDKKFALSQSMIKDWRQIAPNVWYQNYILGKRKFKGKRTMDFGSLLDTLCFTPDLYDKRFIVAECARPSEKVEKILVAVYEHISALNDNIRGLNRESDTKKVPLKKVSLEHNQDVVKKYCLEHDHYASKPDQAYGDIVKKGKEYFQFLKKLGKKVAITADQKKSADELKNILYTDPTSRGFFVPKKGCEVLFQTQLRAEFPIGAENVESIPIKGIPDIIHFNHNKKTVREVDLKYTDDVYLFATGPVKLFDYPMQHSFYNFLIEEWLKTYKDGIYKDYAIMNPLNLVIDEKIKIPYIYRYDFNDLYIKRKGIEGTWIKGWETLLEDIAWHLNKNDFSRPKEHILNGSISIQVFSKK